MNYMKKIILDTNFLMLPAQLFDIFSHIEILLDEPYALVVLETSLSELEKLAKGNSKEAQAAKLGLSLITAKIAENPNLWERLIGLVPYRKEKKILLVKAKGHVDDAIVKMADKETIVATLDKGLQNRLRKRGVPVITFKNKKLVIR